MDLVRLVQAGRAVREWLGVVGWFIYNMVDRCIYIYICVLRMNSRQRQTHQLQHVILCIPHTNMPTSHHIYNKISFVFKVGSCAMLRPLSRFRLGWLRCDRDELAQILAEDAL